MLDCKPQTDAQGVLTITIAFYESEATLFRAGGVEGFLDMLSNTAKNKLHDAGGLGPYTYSCIPGTSKFAPHTLRCQEREF